MTLERAQQILDACEWLEGARIETIRLDVQEAREMATKTIGVISKKALAAGKVQPRKAIAPHFAQAKRAKADRLEAGLRRNRARAGK